jgi:hypothetical protein
VGSTGCESDAECLSDHCFSSQCVCNEDLDDFPCSENEECTFEEGDGYVCKTSEQKLGLDEPCMEDSECETNYCLSIGLWSLTSLGFATATVEPM